ncbi:MAG: Uncharacterised protein [Rhodospirillaceae bacterium]|nr:MAG: Uncharacterised protein [Rhodospirillaceae bacterium]
MDPGLLRGAPAAFPGNDFIGRFHARTGGPNEDGLENALGFDRGGQLGEFFRVKVLAGLERAGRQVRHRQRLDPRARWPVGRSTIVEEGAQAPSQTFLCHCLPSAPLEFQSRDNLVGQRGVGLRTGGSGIIVENRQRV